MKLQLKILGFLLTLTIIWSCAGDSSDNNTQTKDTTSPTVEVDPQINSDSLFGDVNFVLSFSEEVKGLSANSQTTSCTGTIQVQLSTAGSCLPTTISSIDNIVWTIDPVGELSDGNYNLIIKTGITDLSNNTLGQESLTSFRVEDALSTVINNLEIALTNSGLNSTLVSAVKQDARETARDVTNDLLTVIPLVFDGAFDAIMAANLNDSIETGALEVLIESLLSNVAGKSSLILALPEARIAAVPPSFDLLLTNLTTRIATKSGSNSNTLQTLTSALVSNLHKTGATTAEIENTYINKIVETAATVVMQVNTDKPTRDQMLAGLGDGVITGARKITILAINESSIQDSVQTTLTSTATKVDSSYEVVFLVSETDVTTDPETNFQACEFVGESIEQNRSIVAFQASSVPYGETCTSEIRTCSNGILGGSFEFNSCEVVPPLSCDFGSQTVTHGSSVIAFETISVAFGGSCTLQTRACTNGTLSGSYSFDSCSVSPAGTCSFNGLTIDHDDSVIAYEDSFVEDGNECQSEVRSCNDGILNGSFSYQSCSVSKNESCLFNGSPVQHYDTVFAYQSNEVPYGENCIRETRLCNDGNLSGSFKYSECKVNTAKSCELNNKIYSHGEFISTGCVNGSICFNGEIICRLPPIIERVQINGEIYTGSEITIYDEGKPNIVKISASDPQDLPLSYHIKYNAEYIGNDLIGKLLDSSNDNDITFSIGGFLGENIFEQFEDQIFDIQSIWTDTKGVITVEVSNSINISRFLYIEAKVEKDPLVPSIDEVYINGELYSGDTVEIYIGGRNNLIKVVASDPQDLPLEYDLQYYAEYIGNPWNGEVIDNSSEDIKSLTLEQLTFDNDFFEFHKNLYLDTNGKINIRVKNSIGIFEVFYVNAKVIKDPLIPIIKSIYINGNLYQKDEKITLNYQLPNEIKIYAEDPQNLPLEYRVKLDQNFEEIPDFKKDKTILYTFGKYYGSSISELKIEVKNSLNIVEILNIEVEIINLP